jgi:asparagine synthase (glutamine-hydrolysing)
VEFSLSLPDQFKLRAGLRKQVLRDAMAEDVPREILNRRDKIGFSTPELDWFQGAMRATLLNECQKAVSGLPQLFRQTAGPVLARQLDPGSKNSLLPWRIFCFSKWTEIFNVQA